MQRKALFMLRTPANASFSVRSSYAVGIGCRRRNGFQSKALHARQFAKASPQGRWGNSGKSTSTPLLFTAAAAASLAGIAWYLRGSGSPTQKPLSYAGFTALRVASVEEITSDSSIVSIVLPPNLLPDASLYPEPCDTPLQAIYIRQPELQIQRAYTPLELTPFSETDRKNGVIRLLVKKYNDGEVSSYLHRLRAGDEIYIRGPVRTWTLPKNLDHLIFIAGGTGITPLVQLLAHGKDLPAKVTLIYASSSPRTSFASVLPPSATNVYKVTGRISQDQLRNIVGRPHPDSHTQIMVCGPEGFVTSIAGLRGRDAANEVIGGHLGTLGWTRDNVKKL